MTAFQPGSPTYEALIAERAELRAEIEGLREHVNALRLVATSHEPEALRLQAEIEGLREEVAILRTTETADNARLRALILDGCEVFEHYDLPEHALHYRRALEPKP